MLDGTHLLKPEAAIALQGRDVGNLDIPIHVIAAIVTLGPMAAEGAEQLAHSACPPSSSQRCIGVSRIALIFISRAFARP
jgi:hypothetical protein